jgi:MinD-like ATPase involved in chromosome partitioning or flagellar assembly
LGAVTEQHDEDSVQEPHPEAERPPTGTADDTPPQPWPAPPVKLPKRPDQPGQLPPAAGFAVPPSRPQPAARHGGSEAETLAMPAARPDQSAGWQSVPPPREPVGPGKAPRRHWPAAPADLQPRGAAPPAEWGGYVEAIRASDLVPAHRIPPGRGWRRAVFRATFGLVNLGPSPDELRQAELEARARTPLRGNFKIGVLGKGGVGKTTVAVSVGSLLAQLRQDDRVVAIDADTAFGKLGSRVDPHAVGSYWDLASDEHLDSFADVRARVGNNAVGLFVLAGESATARRRVLDPAIYREAASRLDRHFTISIVDCGSMVDAPVTQEALRDVNALIVVSSPWVDGASAAAQTLEYLHNHGLTGLLQRTVVVLNDSDGHADKRTRTVLVQQFAARGQPVFEVPFDSHLRPGGVIDVQHQMAPATRRRFLEIAAALAEHFTATATAPRPGQPRGR